MKGGHVDEEKRRGYGGALWGSDFNWGSRARSVLEDQGTGAFGEKGGDPVYHVSGDVFSEEEGSELGGVNVVESSFDVEKEGRDHPSWTLEGADFIDQGGAGIRGAESRERAALVGVEEAGLVGQLGESDGHDSFQ